MGKTTKNFSMHTGGLTPEEREATTKFLKEKDEQRQKAMATKANHVHEKKASVDFMNVNFEPFEDRILVFPDPVEAKTANGLLYKPEETIAKAKPVMGTVVAIGPGKIGVTTKIPIQPGDRISYGNYAGTTFRLNNIDYLIMRFADCFGKVL